ncbi:Dam family site-specific DNA-(adenine-N6)-methyltransferase [Campylobacter coli]|nr:Dam family site-specific DNA-(adenine-N6)-methyltransferase [Campylobacter coli]
MNKVNISPILYMGNKSRLIRRGLTNLFPNNINRFIDAFAGSATVSMNIKANKYIINDIDETLHSYYAIFSKMDKKAISGHIKQRILEFELPTKTTIRCFSDNKEVEKYKKAYHNFRDFYNSNKTPLDLYTLMFFAFSQQFRVNKNGDFNMPFGNNHFSKNNEESISNGCDFFSRENIEIYKKDFQKLFSDIDLNTDDFVYFDPPYRITLATYNENSSWNEDNDQRLFYTCKKLHKEGVKFGMSNVIINKGIINKELIDFCLLNNFNVYMPNDFKYHACGKENIEQQEVYICNYEIKNTNHKFRKTLLK